MLYSRSRKSICQRIVAAIFQSWDQSRRERRRGQIRQRQTRRSCDDRGEQVRVIERMETRTLLAAVTESGTTLTLNANEAFGIVSNGAEYQFASNQTFTDSGVSVTSEFSAFGGGTLTLLASGLAHCTTIEIVDGGASTSTLLTIDIRRQIGRQIEQPKFQ